MTNGDGDLRQTLFQKFETTIYEFTFGFGRRPSSGRTAMSFSVDVIVISDHSSCVVGPSLFLSLYIYVLHYGLRLFFGQLYLQGNLTP